MAAPPPSRLLPPLDPDVLPQPFRAIDRAVSQIIDGAARIAGLRAQQRDLAGRARAARSAAPAALCAAPGPGPPSAFCLSPAGNLCVAAAAPGQGGCCALCVLRVSGDAAPCAGGRDGRDPAGPSDDAAAAAAAADGASGNGPSAQPVTALDVYAPVTGVGPAARTTTCEWLADGAQAVMAAGAADGSLRILQVAGDGSSRAICDCEPTQLGAPCVGVEFCPEGRWLARLAADGGADLYTRQPSAGCAPPAALVAMLSIEPPPDLGASPQQQAPARASLVWRRGRLLVWWRGSNTLRRYGLPMAEQARPGAVPSAGDSIAPLQPPPTKWTLPHAVACAAVVPRGCAAGDDDSPLALGLANGSVLLFDELQAGFVAALPRLPSPATHLLALRGQGGSSGPPQLLVATEAGVLLTGPAAADGDSSGEPAGAAKQWRQLPLPQLFDVQALLPLAAPSAGGQQKRSHAPLALVVAAAARPATTITGLPPWADLGSSAPTVVSAAAAPQGTAPPPPPSQPRLLAIDADSGALLVELIPEPGLQFDCRGAGGPGRDKCVPLALRGSMLVAAAAARGDGGAAGQQQLLVFDLADVAERASAAAAPPAAPPAGPAGPGQAPAAPPLLAAAGAAGRGTALMEDGAPLSAASLALVRDDATRDALRRVMARIGRGAAPAGGSGGGGGIRAARARGVRDALSALAQQALASEVGGAQQRPLLLGAAGV